ncbi:MAG: dienelactone hydrolase family protein [Acidobacteriia bacterium]|nr:dienelactone hydrolase family protein [Terriglobia bacterium]
MPKRGVPASLAAGLLLWGAGCVAAQSDAVETFLATADGSRQPYALYMPRSFSPAKKYPLVLSLHAEDSNHRFNLKQIFGGTARDAEFIVACPLARGTMGYRGIAEQDVYDVLGDVERRFPIDPDRVYLTGISMGGGGALWLALTRPDLWAAVAPVSAAAIPGSEELAPNLLNLPVKLFHGELDTVIPPDSSRTWQRRLLDLDVAADYVEYPGVRHNAWDFAYKNAALFDWFAGFRRNRFPERVRFATRSYRYSSAYWVHIDGLTPGTLASIDAKRVGTAEVRVETHNVDGFTLALDRPAALVTIDGAAIRVKPAATVSFANTAGRWRAGRLPPEAKHAGAEGPIAEAVAARHIYVYGTVGMHTAEELEARRQTAETAARWSTPNAPLTLELPVKADHAVTPEDMETASLVLFGTAETNSLIARFASRLPLALHTGAADYGLLFLAPVGNHYALVSSGLPWWTGADDAHRGGDPFAPAQYRLLATFGDYILFKGSLAHVVAEGRFDRNWKLPADAAAKMSGTGTVTILK